MTRRKTYYMAGRNKMVWLVIGLLFCMTALIAFSRFADINDLIIPERMDSAYVHLHAAELGLSADSIQDNPRDLGMEYISVKVKTSDGITLNCWYIQPLEEGAVTILLLHDLGKSRISMLEEAMSFHERGFGICLPDLRAHGTSGGETSSLGFQEASDIRTIIDTLFRMGGMGDIAVIGHGMGASAGLKAAISDTRIKSLVAEGICNNLSNFVQVRAARKWGSLNGILFPVMKRKLEAALQFSIDSVNPVRQARMLNIPSLFVSATDHEMNPPSSTRDVYDACGSVTKKLWIIKGKNYQAAGEDYYNKIALFIVKSPPRKFIKTKFRRLA